ncbi:MAG: DUF1957 domain-containing protein [Candidatus Brocadiae bacterium]|nr:DUF1957 domain-containing protein [Candidatus Brocadiia bacterium]
MHQGSVLLVLHAHLPFVRHPEHAEFLEEDWFYEAVTETYIPLLDLAEDLESRGSPARFSLVLSPTLCEMLADPLLMGRYQRRLEGLIDLAGREVARRAGDGAFREAARANLVAFETARRVFVERHRGNLLAGFRALQDAGRIEILTCGATHGLFPLMERAESVRAQVRVAVRNYERHFGRRPSGMWLPECGFRPGHDRILAAEGIRYFCVESHAVVFASPRPKYTLYAPIRTPGGPSVFARDIESGRQVWSATEGYPGDPAYREFYRDLGFDGAAEDVRPWLHADGVRRNLGIKLHRVTGAVPLHEKQPWNPAVAFDRARTHAAHFHDSRVRQLRELRARLGRPAVLLSPYDAELFGHWWFEGPRFLAALLDRAAEREEVLFTTPGAVLAGGPPQQVAMPTLSTWGSGGYNSVWLNPSNDWTYPPLHALEDRMIALVRGHRHASGPIGRALRQAAREFLLAQSSDWAFIMNAGTAVSYAHKRFKSHVDGFLTLEEQVRRWRVDEGRLADLEGRDNCFPEIDVSAWEPEGVA